jgi:hypothetical protein
VAASVLGTSAVSRQRTDMILHVFIKISCRTQTLSHWKSYHGSINIGDLAGIGAGMGERERGSLRVSGREGERESGRVGERERGRLLGGRGSATASGTLSHS